MPGASSPRIARGRLESQPNAPASRKPACSPGGCNNKQIVESSHRRHRRGDQHYAAEPMATKKKTPDGRGTRLPSNRPRAATDLEADFVGSGAGGAAVATSSSRPIHLVQELDQQPHHPLAGQHVVGCGADVHLPERALERHHAPVDEAALGTGSAAGGGVHGMRRGPFSRRVAHDESPHESGATWCYPPQLGWPTREEPYATLTRGPLQTLFDPPDEYGNGSVTSTGAAGARPDASKKAPPRARADPKALLAPRQASRGHLLQDDTKQILPTRTWNESTP